MGFWSLVAFVAPVCTCSKDYYLYLRKRRKLVQKIEENLQSLRKEVKYVDAFRKNAEEEAKRDATTKELTRCGEVVLDQCKTEVEKFNEIEIKYEREKSQKPFNFFALAKLSKDIKTERMNEVAKLIDKIKIGGFFTSKQSEPFDEIINAEDISDLPSLDEKAKELSRYLEDKDVRTVGIYGPPGIGIKAILKNLYYELERLHDKLNPALPHNQSSFDLVIWVTVGIEKSVISKIQQAIANKLQINIGNVTPKFEALEETRFLLLLDEVHSPVDLIKVGITSKHKYGKVVIATGSNNVIKTMNLDREILVETLSKIDARKLFRKYVGNVVDRERIKYTAERIVDELGGLPQLIKLVGSRLNGVSDETKWNSMRSIVQARNESDDPELQALVGVYNVYKSTYDKLSLDRKKCILYGALFPRDYKICKDYLVESWTVERFMHGILGGEVGDNQLYSAARNEGNDIMEVLTDEFLLDRCATKEYVKMPVIFRKIALRSLYPKVEDGKVLVRAGEGIDEHHVEKEWTDAKRVSLMCNDLQCLTSSPQCSKISTLLLQCNKLLRTIKDSFFSDMSDLRVLDLSHTGIKQLPLRVCRLSNLKGLYLVGCDGLTSIPAEIKRLRSLEVLDIRDTAIQYLPTQIQFLVRLRCLRFSFIGNVDCANNGVDMHCIQRVLFRLRKRQREIVPPNLVKNLCQLEELTIIVGQMYQGWDAIADRIAKEMASLRELTTLYFYFPNIESLETFINESRPRKNPECQFLRSFNFQIGYYERHHFYGIDCCGNSPERHLRLSIGDPTVSAVRDVLKQASTFEMIGHQTITNLSDFGMEYVKELEVCVIEACDNMVSIIADNGDVAFPYLEKLHIINLKMLECIQKVPIVNESFSKLTILTLKGCPELSKILTPKISHALTELQHLRVENCPKISSIIEANENESGRERTSEEPNLSGALPKLKKLELDDLEALVSICGNTTLDWLSLAEIEMRACGALRHLSLTETNARQLRLIKCKKDWWRALELEQAVKKRLNLLCSFFREEERTTAEAPTGSSGCEPQDHLPDLGAISNHK